MKFRKADVKLRAEMSNSTQFELEPFSGQTRFHDMSLRLSWNAYGMLSRIDWIPGPTSAGNTLSWAPGQILEFVHRLKDFFKTGKPLGTLPWEWIDQSEWTPFQYKVFACIARIPHGETRTYGWVAHRIGSPSATRAVGQALRKNPVPLLVPCHRVVGTNSLGGFMGTDNPQDAEMSFKRSLIAVEQSYLNPFFSFMDSSASSAVAG